MATDKPHSSALSGPPPFPLPSLTYQPWREEVMARASQQLFTGLVDSQAQTVLESVGNKTYVPSGGS